MTLRRATALDAHAIQQLIKTVYDEYGFSWDPEGYHRDLYDFESHFSDPDGAYWIVEDETGVLGGGGVVAFPAHSTEHSAEGLRVVPGADSELVRMYLRVDQRGKGIGKMLASEILSWARARGCRRMEIWSDITLTLAHPFYQKLGAIPVGTRICNDPDAAEEFGFVLDLS